MIKKVQKYLSNKNHLFLNKKQLLKIRENNLMSPIKICNVYLKIGKYQISMTSKIRKIKILKMLKINFLSNQKGINIKNINLNLFLNLSFLIKTA